MKLAHRRRSSLASSLAKSSRVWFKDEEEQRAPSTGMLSTAMERETRETCRWPVTLPWDLVVQTGKSEALIGLIIQ